MTVNDERQKRKENFKYCWIGTEWNEKYLLFVCGVHTFESDFKNGNSTLVENWTGIA